MLASIGFGSRKIRLPEWAHTGVMWAGVIGMLLFGSASLVGAFARWTESRKV